ncbi:helix-turn-helix domain-containing protein [Paracoccus saliphilus]|uniref:HTH cro/C1-type domain-containing protein n=1 Tax=Paracoccus saliphilus TaxID=405559 RepID=A0ABY7S2Z4_9RHOB|nr:hypothetical protein [Paracoccus saliphilus]WCR01439.1 hypothetical protein JHX88_10780 [Paracoccus saliphilus]
MAIEQGKANPSIGVLCRVAAALSVSIGDLLVAPDQSRPVARMRPKTLWVGSKGGMTWLDVSTSGQKMFELWSWTLILSKVYQAEAHGPGTRELISFQLGKLRITIGTGSLTLQSGEATRLRTDWPHFYAGQVEGENRSVSRWRCRREAGSCTQTHHRLSAHVE